MSCHVCKSYRNQPVLVHKLFNVCLDMQCLMNGFERNNYFGFTARRILELSQTPLHPLPNALVSVHDGLFIYDNVGCIRPGFAHPGSDGHRVCLDDYTEDYGG